MPRHSQAEKTVRLNFQVTPDVKNLLESLRIRSGADTLTEVMRCVLATYELLQPLRWSGDAEWLRRHDFGSDSVLA